MPYNSDQVQQKIIEFINKIELRKGADYFKAASALESIVDVSVELDELPEYITTPCSLLENFSEDPDDECDPDVMKFQLNYVIGNTTKALRTQFTQYHDMAKGALDGIQVESVEHAKLIVDELVQLTQRSLCNEFSTDAESIREYFVDKELWVQNPNHFAAFEDIFMEEIQSYIEKLKAES